MIRDLARSLAQALDRGPRVRSHPPRHLRIAPFLGHGSAGRVAVRGRVLDNRLPQAAVAGEGTAAAVRRMLGRFLAEGLPGVPLRVRVGPSVVETTTDRYGYFDAEVDTSLPPSAAPWMVGEVELAAPYRGITQPHTTQFQVRRPGQDARFGVISDVDDTILLTGAQRVLSMVRTTVTGSALTRAPFAGAAELYRAWADAGPAPGDNPLFYVSSSPWPLHDFLTGFLAHRQFPLGPLLLRNVRGTSSDSSHQTRKRAHIEEILRMHPHLDFVLVGDSGQHDPEIYAGVVRDHPGRILAIYIREVRLDPGDRRVESITDAWSEDVPFVVAADSTAVAEHAAWLGLISDEAAREVRDATVRTA